MSNYIDQGALAEKAFAEYEFGDGVMVTDTSGWEYTTPGYERTRKVYVETEPEDDGPAPRWVLNFTVRFDSASGALSEACAIDEKGQIWGNMASQREVSNYIESPNTRPVMSQESQERKHSASLLNWFGNSIVAKDGKPQLVFHGTTASFEKFALTDGVEMRGVFFTQDADEAREWALRHGTEARVVSAYLRIDNPADYGDVREIIDRFHRSGRGAPSPSQVTSALKREGYDGYVDDRGGFDEYVVFSPLQIWLADLLTHAAQLHEQTKRCSSDEPSL